MELAYQVEGTENYIAPQLLAAHQPDYKKLSGPLITLRYRYKFMPKGILTRFIVKRHQDIYNETRWRYGVVLDYDDTRALIREKYFDRKITIQLEGRDKKGFLELKI